MLREALALVLLARRHPLDERRRGWSLARIGAERASQQLFHPVAVDAALVRRHAVERGAELRRRSVRSSATSGSSSSVVLSLRSASAGGDAAGPSVNLDDDDARRMRARSSESPFSLRGGSRLRSWRSVEMVLTVSSNSRRNRTLSRWSISWHRSSMIVMAPSAEKMT